VDVPFLITTCRFLLFAAAKSEPMRPLQKSFKLTHLFERVASTALFFEYLKVSRRRFSGFPQKVDGSHLKQFCAFLPTKRSHTPPSSSSALFNAITHCLSTKRSTRFRVTYTPCLCFPIFRLTFSLWQARN